jgi:hypothetical protein
MPEPIVIDTLQKLIDGGYTLTAHCDKCLHQSFLDLNRLADKFGPQFDFVVERPKLLSGLYCAKCGSKRISTILGAPTTGTAGGAHGSYTP